MGILANENAISSGGYQIQNSLRFQSASSQYLSRTPASSGTLTKWTLSFWVKRGLLSSSSEYQLFSNSNGSNLGFICTFNNDTFKVADYSGSFQFQLVTTAVYRDPSAWYHIVVAFDSTQATSSNRVRLYVNGSEVTALSTATYPSLNYSGYWNNTNPATIGRNTYSASPLYFDGYMTEIYNIDGQQLTPSSFGNTDPTSGQWVAAKYTGTYGTNGFYLPFSNGTSTTTLGADSSGNSNNWTLTNFTRSAGVSDCWMVDVPSGNGGASGTQPNSNYAVMNPLDKGTSQPTFSNANLNITSGSSGTLDYTAASSVGMTSGKWYAECTVLSGTRVIPGVVNSSISSTTWYTVATQYISGTGTIYKNNVSQGTFATFTTGDVIGMAYDADNQTLAYYKNNTLITTLTSLGYTGIVYFYADTFSSSSCAFNFGQRSFAYTPPTGFKALCTANLPVATIKQGNKYMDATLYTGNGTGLTVTNAGSFKPDLVWTKIRSSSGSHVLIDSVRGLNHPLWSDLTGVEGTATAGTGITAINSNGWTLGTDISTSGSTNNNGSTYVGWQWQAGQGSTSSNTNGSITSTTSVNATAGFSVVTYTGTGANATVGHGLGVTPKMVIIKNRSAVASWQVWSFLTTQASGSCLTSTTFDIGTNKTGGALILNSTGAAGTYAIDNQVNANGNTYVAYCFAEIAGFSKFGSYTGNGSADGTFVYLGFRPKYVMVKYSSSADNWDIFDSVRNPYNLTNNKLYANLSDAESADAFSVCDLLSNGFKLRGTGNQVNANGGTYIYMAFAESPFQNSNSR